MVTVQQAGVMYWQSATSHHLLPAYQAAAICAPAVPCQWHHHHTATGIAAAVAGTGAAPTPPNVQQSIPTPPLAPTSYLPPSAQATTPVARYHHHRTPPAPERQLANAVEPEQPIGYGSFGVVW